MDSTQPTKIMYLVRGNSYYQTNERDTVIVDELPPGCYTVQLNALTGQYYYDAIDNFSVPEKTYGTTKEDAKRIIDTYVDRQKKASTGVLLAGEKGSGKTMLAKTTALLAQELLKLPVIIVNTPFADENFKKSISSLGKAVIMFDEMEKVYDEDQQNQLLTLFDGLYDGRLLFLVTCNDKFKIGTFFHNRPGRFYYMLSFEGLDANFIQEYCEDNLNDKSKIQEVAIAASLYDNKFNFDMLQALVEEMNRYGEGAQQCLHYLNIKPGFLYSLHRYKVESVTVDGVPATTTETHINGSPITTAFGVHIVDNAAADKAIALEAKRTKKKVEDWEKNDIRAEHTLYVAAGPRNVINVDPAKNSVTTKCLIQGKTVVIRFVQDDERNSLDQLLGPDF